MKLFEYVRFAEPMLIKFRRETNVNLIWSYSSSGVTIYLDTNNCKDIVNYNFSGRKLIDLACELLLGDKKLNLDIVNNDTWYSIRRTDNSDTANITCDRFPESFFPCRVAVNIKFEEE